MFDPVLDPTNEALYSLLNDFFGEMAALFPDSFIHIGGDENNGVQWSANPKIQTYIRENGLKDNEGLHAYFNGRLAEILARHDKRLVGWDEILHPGLPLSSVIHSWRGADALAAAAHLGYSGILSNGYYIDLSYPTVDHYLTDPLPATTKLTSEEQRRVLGGEATMWSEWVTPETIDSRIWPRTAAIAERLWSPREVNDVADMYRRLPIISERLDEAGLLHEKNRLVMLHYLVSPNVDADSIRALQTLVDLLEPVKHYARGRLQNWSNQLIPLVGFADAARPDSTLSRNFADAVNRVLFENSQFDAKSLTVLSEQLKDWSSMGQFVAATLAPKFPALREAVKPAHSLAEASDAGEDAVQVLLLHTIPTEEWLKFRLALLDHAAQPSPSATELPILRPIRLLVFAAYQQNRRTEFSTDAWRKHLNELAFPAKR